MTMYHSHKKNENLTSRCCPHLRPSGHPAYTKQKWELDCLCFGSIVTSIYREETILYKELHITLKLSLKSSDATNVAPQNTNLLEPKDFRFFLTHVNYETL